jgi:hypothetical protein
MGDAMMGRHEQLIQQREKKLFESQQAISSARL